MELGGQKGELSRTYYLMSIEFPTGRDIALHLQQEVTLLFYPQQEEERFSPCLAAAQPMRDCHDSASEKPLYFELPVSSNGLFVYNSPSQLPPLLYKRVNSPLRYLACMWFAIVACPEWQIFVASE